MHSKKKNRPVLNIFQHQKKIIETNIKKMQIMKKKSDEYIFLQIQGLNSLPHVVLYGKDRLEFAASSSSASPSARKVVVSSFFFCRLLFFSFYTGVLF
jgi:hypothetical protein